MRKYMEKTMRSMCLLILCIIMLFGRNTIENGQIIRNQSADNILADPVIADEAGRKLDLHMGRSAAKDICYISYSVETRKSGKGYGKEKEISVMRIIRK